MLLCEMYICTIDKKRAEKYDQLLTKFEELVTTKIVTVGISIVDWATLASPVSAAPIPRRTYGNAVKTTTITQQSNCCSNATRDSHPTNAVFSSIEITTHNAMSSLPTEYIAKE